MGDKPQSNKDIQDFLDRYLYKLISISLPNQEKIITLPFKVRMEAEQCLSPAGKPETTTKYYLTMLDISKSIQYNEPYIEEALVTDTQELNDSIELVDPNDNMPLLSMASTLIYRHMTAMSQEMQVTSQSMLALKQLLPSNEVQTKGNLILTNDENNLASILYHTITGDTALLSQAQVEKVGQVIMDIIQAHLATDLKDPINVKKIVAEVEYKLIEALPDDTKAGKIQINTSAIIQEIQKFQESNPDMNDNYSSDDDNDEDEDNQNTESE